MATWTIAAKDLRLLLRDRRAGVILIAMPLVLILVLGVALGDWFGVKPDDRLRVSVVIQDHGLQPGEPLPPPAENGGPFKDWSQAVLYDLRQSAGIRVEVLPDRETAEHLVRRGKRSAVLVFGPEFSDRLARCSFLVDASPARTGINPFFRDGVDFASLQLEVFRDPTQLAAAAIIEQVGQGTLLRVILPWMIGRAFDEFGRQLPIAVPVIKRLFARYDLSAKTWSKLTRSLPDVDRAGSADDRPNATGSGFLERGTLRYQVLVPSYTVTFAFFLVLTAGWLFVSERRQGTLVRLRVAPLPSWQVLSGKLLPCLAVSILQGILLLVAGKFLFGMTWGRHPGLLLLVVFCTSVAATGLALLVAGAARTESQVAVYGTLLVLVLAAVSGSLMPRDLMPEAMKTWSKLTPHAWALDAYNQLLLNPNPEVAVIWTSCGVLLMFGLASLLLGWWRVRLD